MPRSFLLGGALAALTLLSGCLTAVPGIGCHEATAKTDCAAGEHCSNQDGACLHPDPATNACYGECVADLTPCIDSDSGIDIFTPGYVTFTASTGPTTTVYDKCSDDGLSVIEAYCYNTANGSRVETVAVKCPSVGCVASSGMLGAACYQ